MPISEATSPVRLVWPSHAHLAGYVAALERGWSPNNLRPEAAQEELLLIRADADGFLKSLVDREAMGPQVTLPDGTQVPRLPGYRRWLWDGEFCGSIGLRWQPGTNTLPSYCLGHIGYAVVPWKSGRGYAKEALRSLLPDIAPRRLPHMPAERRAERAGRPVAHAFGNFRNTEVVANEQVLRHRHAPGQQVFHRRPSHGA
jgi:predicted acetyltransferase